MKIRAADRKKLIATALGMVRRAYAPYSRFQVGAAVLTSSGRIYGGANVENASYGAAVCAERAAVLKAVNAGDRELAAVAVCGGREGKVTGLCVPCGICRQVLREFADPAELKVYVVQSANDYREYSLEDLLPESFGPESL